MDSANTNSTPISNNPIKTSLFDEAKFRASLPAEMLSQKRFVRYFLQPKADGIGYAKVPLGNHSDPTTWSTFDEAVQTLENDGQGIGYNFLGGEIHGLDIDHCRNPRTGQLCPEAMKLLERTPSWSEYSVSGQGIHVFFKGQVRGKQLTETCLQYWNPKNSPRFFALTCDMVGEAFTTIKDVGEEFNYVFATARHISAKIREELKTVDYEQWAALPVERAVEETKEKPKTKTRKVAAGFDIKDFLSFYGLQIANETDNELGHCIRLTTCPLKGEAHAGHNSTTCNFIYPCADGGLAFHCQSTGCCEYGIKEALEALASANGPYPKTIYETKASSDGSVSVLEFTKPREPYTNNVFVLDPTHDREDGIFPLGDTSLIAGKSGSNKTIWMRGILGKQKRGEVIYEHTTRKLPYLILMADRGKRDQERTEKQNADMGFDPAPIEYLKHAMGFEVAQEILKKIEEQPILPKVVFVEGMDFLVEDPSKSQLVKPLMYWLNEIADYYNLAIIGSVGSPKTTIKAGYVAARDQVIGTQAWGRMASTIVHLGFGDGGDDRSDMRVISILKRHGKTEKYELVWENNKLVDYQPEPEFDLDDNDPTTWIKGRAEFTLKEFKIAFPKMSGSTANKQLNALITLGKVKRDGSKYKVIRELTIDLDGVDVTQTKIEYTPYEKEQTL